MSPTRNTFDMDRTAHFGRYALDLDSGELRRGTFVVDLPGQPTALLLLLVERAGRLVTRDEIRDRLWPAGAVLEFDQRGVRSGQFVKPLSAVGRMALSVYLTQTLAFTTLFYGYGFGRAFRLGPAVVTGWALLIFAFQIIACGWWVRRYRFGPAEWIWRALTYLRFPSTGESASRGTHRS